MVAWRGKRTLYSPYVCDGSSYHLPSVLRQQLKSAVPHITFLNKMQGSLDNLAPRSCFTATKFRVERTFLSSRLFFWPACSYITLANILNSFAPCWFSYNQERKSCKYILSLPCQWWSYAFWWLEMSSLICDYLLTLDGMKKTVLSRQNSAYTTMRLLAENLALTFSCDN